MPKSVETRISLYWINTVTEWRENGGQVTMVLVVTILLAHTKHVFACGLYSSNTSGHTRTRFELTNYCHTRIYPYTLAFCLTLIQNIIFNKKIKELKTKVKATSFVISTQLTTLTRSLHESLVYSDFYVLDSNVSGHISTGNDLQQYTHVAAS